MDTIRIDDVVVPLTTGESISFHLATSGAIHQPPVLWLHGSGPGVTALTNWERIIDELAGDFFNVAPDIVGFGDSTHPEPPPQGVAAFTEYRVDTLAALLDHLGISQVDMVGNSMGGVIALCFALKYPGRVRRIVLMGAGGAPVPMTPELMALIRFFDQPTVEAMAALMTTFVHDPSAFGHDLTSIAAQRMARAMRPEVERSHRATFVPGDPLPITADSMAKVTHPVLVVHGDDDRLVPLASGQWYADVLPNAQLEVIPDAGHWLQIEQHDRFVGLVRAFLTPK